VEKVYSWCSVGKRERKQDMALSWVSASKEPLTSERCLSLELKDAKFDLDFTECGKQLAYICEVYILYSALRVKF